MATYNIPRNTKGEGKILFIFSPKALAYTFIGLIFGYILAQFIAIFKIRIFKLFDLSILAYPLMGFVGFAIATFKMPEIPNIKFTHSTSGLKIDEVIMKAINFKRKGKRIYVYAKEEKSDD